MPTYCRLRISHIVSACTIRQAEQRYVRRKPAIKPGVIEKSSYGKKLQAASVKTAQDGRSKAIDTMHTMPVKQLSVSSGTMRQ